MFDPVYLSTYFIRIKNKGARVDQLLNLFNGADDIYPHLQTLLDDLFATPRVIVNNEERGTKIRFTLKSPPIVEPKERVIYGFFETCFVGENIDIQDITDRSEAFKGDRERHGSVKPLFFYFKFPLNETKGYFITQKRPRYGVKSAFHKEFVSWLRYLGYMDSTLHINPVLSGQVFANMLGVGNLKKIDLVIHRIPANYEAYMSDNLDNNPEMGKLTTTIQAKKSLSQSWKDFALRQYLKRKNNTTIELGENIEEYDEIEFQIELKGKTKTFYAKNKARVLPDMDVSDSIQYDPDGYANLNSLLEKCQEIILDVFRPKPNV